jgi:hypothetical protein
MLHRHSAEIVFLHQLKCYSDFQRHHVPFFFLVTISNLKKKKEKSFISSQRIKSYFWQGVTSVKMQCKQQQQQQK